jgi:hypothetical protein
VAGPRSRLRLIALLSVAAWAVHQLRYALAFGSGQGDALQRTGHGYLEVAGPIAGLLLLAAAAQLVTAFARRHAEARGTPLSLGRAWALLTVILLVVFSVQELLEGALSAGHAGGLAGLVGQGGWLAAPLAVLAALAVAVTLHEAEEAVAAAPVRLVGVLRWVATAPRVVAVAACRPPARPPARHLAGRGPPAPVA